MRSQGLRVGNNVYRLWTVYYWVQVRTEPVEVHIMMASVKTIDLGNHGPTFDLDFRLHEVGRSHSFLS